MGKRKKQSSCNNILICIEWLLGRNMCMGVCVCPRAHENDRGNWRIKLLHNKPKSHFSHRGCDVKREGRASFPTIPGIRLRSAHPAASLAARWWMVKLLTNQQHVTSRYQGCSASAGPHSDFHSRAAAPESLTAAGRRSAGILRLVCHPSIIVVVVVVVTIMHSKEHIR